MFKIIAYILFQDSLMNRKIQISAFIWNKKSFKLIKSGDKDIYNVTKDFYFRYINFLLKFLLIKETWNLLIYAVFNIIHFLYYYLKKFDQQIRIIELFLKDHVTGVMMTKIQLWNHIYSIQIENRSFKYYKYLI